MIGPDSFATTEFARIAGKAADDVMFAAMADPRKRPEANLASKSIRAGGFEPEGYTLIAYAAIEIWAQAARATNEISGKEIARWLHAGQRLDTAIGEIELDAKGDLRDQPFIWYRFSKGRIMEDSAP